MTSLIVIVYFGAHITLFKLKKYFIYDLVFISFY